MTTFVSFARRQNHDSSIDSICTKCYQTVARACTVSELVAPEENHRCDPNMESDRRQTVFPSQCHS
jgi:hypothetical protein